MELVGIGICMMIFGFFFYDAGLKDARREDKK